ncbi:response regulator transcription factor [Flavobacterium dankookense]|uniref:AraC-like DNA-binding protein n=1 Tax=Flavobacterium dankookense TaxID=706186 RepID=A0A4R6QFQ8_9FLAO|nr:response regulator transcription factor [Flavobacterium dankookense]TDP61137.1 AraC-like DNA-binding protein [Flavobacterium dankookense]
MKKKLILIVEDDFLIAKSARYILEEEGYDVIVNVDNYLKAIEIIQNKKPDLILVDISIKGDQDGIELGKYLLNSDDIPYIYISSHTDKITLERVKDTRPYGFIVKPFKEMDLVTTVSLVLNNYSFRDLDPKRNNKHELDSIDEVPFRIRGVVEYINEHINEKIDINTLAQLTNWKAHHFIRMFSNLIGVTPYQYILKKKIENIKVKLEETDQPIMDIAYATGFQSYSNFSIAFKKIAGVSPEVYRIKSRIHHHLHKAYDNSFFIEK